jgi:CxxC motif-containing protein
MGCALEVDENGGADLSVTGNRCPRGAVYAQEEVRSPKRTVTATCRTNGAFRLPVKTVSPCPREKIPALLRDIYKTQVTLPVKAGDVVIADWKGEKIDIIATRSI